MMKNLRSVFVVSVLTVFCVLMNPVLIRAEYSDAAPKEVYCGVGGKDKAAGVINLYMEEAYYIKNLKFSSSQVKGTINKTKANADEYMERGDIRFYAKKEGKYSATFDVYTTNGKKYRSFSVKIRAFDGYDRTLDPVDLVKSVSLNGKKMKFQGGGNWGEWCRVVTGLTSAKVEVELWGYKPKNLLVYTMDKNGNRRSKVVKNGSRIVFSKYSYESPHMSSNDKLDEYYGTDSWVNEREFYADTAIQIASDEKLPLERYFMIDIFSPVEKWYKTRD